MRIQIPDPYPYLYKVILVYLMLLCSFAHKPLQVGIVFYKDVPIEERTRLFDSIKSALHLQYQADVWLADERALPKFAYYKARKRYKADSLLIDLNKVSGYDKVIGITYKDISTSKNGYEDWGIQGLASQPGKTGVVSAYRLDSPKFVVMLNRVVVVTLHEAGHTYGLSHCPDPKCFMNAGSGKVEELDANPHELCEKCRKKLAQIFGKLK